MKRKFEKPILKIEYDALEPQKKIKTEKNNVYEVWHDVSNWTEYQTKNVLKMNVVEMEEFAPKFIKTCDLPIELLDLVAPSVEKKHITTYNPKKFKDLPERTDMMASHLFQIVASKRRETEERNPEAPVDGFVSFLFDSLGFASRGLLFRPKPKQIMQYGEIEIIAIPDYGVKRFDDLDSFVLLEESKPRGIKTGFDHQIMGQMFVFAWAKFEMIGEDVDLFSLAVSGTYVVFYFVHFPVSYMNKIKQDLIPDESDMVSIYKSKIYDFIDKEDRKECIENLYSIRQQLRLEIF